MKLDDAYLDINSATIAESGRAMIGWSRRIEVHEGSVDISVLSPPGSVSSDSLRTAVTIQCTPKRLSVDPINWAGWLALDMLEPGHVYWLELVKLGYTDIRSEDGDPDRQWQWRVPYGEWSGALCE